MRNEWDAQSLWAVADLQTSLEKGALRSCNIQSAIRNDRFASMRNIQSLTTTARCRGNRPCGQQRPLSRSTVQSHQCASGRYPFHPKRGGALISLGQRWPGGEGYGTFRV